MKVGILIPLVLGTVLAIGFVWYRKAKAPVSPAENGGGNTPSSVEKIENKKDSAMKISSSAFANDSDIPAKYTCDDGNINPPLAFENVPETAVSLALIVDDPDALGGTWVHWVLYNMDPSTKGIMEGLIPGGSVQGVNDFKQNSYEGPCPPAGTHRYFFKLYALDSKLFGDVGKTKADLEKAMQGHILEYSELSGAYSR